MGVEEVAVGRVKRKWHGRKDERDGHGLAALL